MGGVHIPEILREGGGINIVELGVQYHNDIPTILYIYSHPKSILYCMNSIEYCNTIVNHNSIGQ